MSIPPAPTAGIARRRAARTWLAALPGAPARVVFTAATAAIALHVVVDAFVVPEPATSATEHLGSAAVPLAILVALAVLYPRVQAGLRATMALVLCPLALVGASVALRHATAVAPRGDDWTGVMLLPAGLTLGAQGVWLLWRSRRHGGRRHLRRIALAVGAAVAAFWVVLPIAIAIVATHRPREAAQRIDLGRVY
jgi:hypothetical protein